MEPETSRREELLRCLFILLSLVVPALVGYDVVYQFRAPTLDFFLAEHNPSVVAQVVTGGQAEAAGLRVGDVVLTMDGVLFTARPGLQLGQTPTLEVERDGQRLTFTVPVVSVGQINRLPLVSAAVVVLTFWSTGTLLLLRRFRQGAVRLLFLLAQTSAIFLLVPLAHPNLHFAPGWLAFLSIVCFYLVAPLLLHYYLTFPVLLGSPRQRRWGLGLLYGLALVAMAGGRSRTVLGLRLGASYTALQIIVAVVVMTYVYLRRATPDGRRRLRLIVLGTLLATVPPILFYLLPLAAGTFPRTPEWLAGLFLVLAPLSYLYATAHHNLFGIDRLLNRALVYALLSLGIFAIFLGPLLLLYRFLPGDVLLQTMIVAGLTLLVSLSFNWTRAQVQHLVDKIFYGGWYDYPVVVETISGALARTIEREQLAGVLTRQVSELMHLHPGQLWIGKPNQSPPLPHSHTPTLSFPLTFQEQVCGLWIIEPRLDGDDFAAADHRILETLACQAEVALRNVLLVEALRRQLNEIRAMQHQLLRSREEERSRLARDLHDGPIQALVGLNIQLGLLLVQWDKTAILPVSPEDALKSMRTEVRELLADLRQVCIELRPPMLDTLGLGAALRALTEDWSAQCGVEVRLDLPPDATLRPLPDEVAVNLYRVVQEALTNVARHAAARLVTVRLSWEDSCLVLTTHDDGQGFVVPAAFHDLAVQGHFGLVGMRERVELIGGALTVESAPGRGTTMRVVKNVDWQD
jgi:signal transduction histidine kinase